MGFRQWLVISLVRPRGWRWPGRRRRRHLQQPRCRRRRSRRWIDAGAAAPGGGGFGVQGALHVGLAGAEQAGCSRGGWISCDAIVKKYSTRVEESALTHTCSRGGGRLGRTRRGRVLRHGGGGGRVGRRGFGEAVLGSASHTGGRLPVSRRREFCHFADIISPSLLKRPNEGRGGCSRTTVSPTATDAPDSLPLPAAPQLPRGSGRRTGQQ